MNKTNMKYLCLIFFLLLGTSHAHSFCGHDKLFKNKKLTPISPIASRKLTSTTRKFNFFVDYSSINSARLVSQEYISNIKILMEELILFFQELLMAVDEEYFFSVQHEELVPFDKRFTAISKEVADGLFTDLIIFPLVVDDLGETTVAAAGAFKYRPDNERPCAGILLLGTNYDFSDKKALKNIKSVLAHEVTHIFGFSLSLFTTYKEKNILKTKYINGVERLLIASPRVLKAAKKHFGCESIDGLELENQGGEGSAGSHWEARVMLGDYMVSTVFPDFVISEMTLALLEDSGWYKVNYYTGGLFRFGKNQGCDFLNKKCYERNKPNFKPDFCNPYSDVDTCFAGHRHRGSCYLYLYENIPDEYQYFSNPNAGGFFPADYCPVSQYTFDKKENVFLEGNCQEGQLYDDSTNRKEVIGPNSICVDSSLHNSQSVNKRGTCYPISCNFEELRFNITIDSKIITCGKNMSSEHTVEGFTGSLKCPIFSRVCTSETWCTDMFDCVAKKAIQSNSTYYDDGQNYQSVSFLGLFILLLAIII